MTPQDQNDELRIVPQSREAEEAVIGSILINPGAYYDVAEILEADDFYIHRHRWIWDAFTALQKSNTPIDSLTVVEHLARKDQLTQLGGPAYITQLINAVPTSLNAVSYAHIVEETATRRRMLEAANTIAQLAYRENQSLDDVVDAAVREVHEITDQVHKRDLIPFSQIMDLLHTHVDAAEQARQRGEALGVYTGFRKLDALLMGLQPADLIVVAARPGVGKTSLLLTIIKQAAQQKTPKHTAIFSLEMPNYQLGLRMVSQETGLSTQKLRSGELNADEWDAFIQAAIEMNHLNIFSDDTPAITPLQMLSKARRMHRQHGLDLIVVDYLQLMSSGGRFENRVQEVSFISRSLKLIAKELNIPVVAAAQLSRAVEQRKDKRPILSDLRESGAIEQDSDVVMFLHRPEDADNGDTELIIAKHRNGPLGMVPLQFVAEQAKFRDAVRGAE